MIDRMDQNQDIVNRYLNDPEFQSVAFKAIVKRIYKELRRGEQPPAISVMVPASRERAHLACT